MNHDDRPEIPIDPRVKDFYLMAEDYAAVDAAALNPSLNKLKSILQRYQSPKRIAEGGMKQIFKVYDARAKRDLAMAMLRNDAPEDLCDPFIHEAWLTALLAHPNIITIHDIGVNAQGKPYFTMDLKEGESLRELIEKLHSGNRAVLKRYPRETLLQIFLKICDAMAYAHSINVLHLDLKPANIQVGEFGQVLVCDWGMGKVLGGEDPMALDHQLLNPDLLSSVTLYGELKGTPGNMAPEQVLKKKELNARTDVYGLGCVLYSLLTYLRPISGKETEDVLRKTMEGEIVPPHERTPGLRVPKALSAVVIKAMATDPAKRYASVSALRTEVHRYLTGYATEAENAGVATQMQLFYQRNRRFCLTIACSLLMGICGAAWSFMRLSHKEEVATEARENAERILSLYQMGQGQLEVLGSRYDETLRTVVRKHKQAGNYSAANRMLDAALSESPSNPVYLYEKGLYHFTQQQFNAALMEFERAGSNDEVVKVARMCAEVKLDEELLTPERLGVVFERLSEHGPLLYRMLRYDQHERLSLEGRVTVAKAYLAAMNPEWVDRTFEYDAERGRLRIGGRGLRKFGTMGSALAGLQPRELNIRGTDLEALDAVLSYPVEVLDISDTPFSSRATLRRMLHLRELTVSKEQYQRLRLAQLPHRVVIRIID